MNGTLTDFRDGKAEWPTLRQEGQTVFRWAVWEMAKVAKEAIEAAGVTVDDLAAFIPHQANMRIVDEFAKQLKLPESVVIAPRHRIDRQHLGRLDPARHAPPAAGTPRGTERHLALQIGFGAGLVFGAQVVVLP